MAEVLKTSIIIVISTKPEASSQTEKIRCVLMASRKAALDSPQRLPLYTTALRPNAREAGKTSDFRVRQKQQHHQRVLVDCLHVISPTLAVDGSIAV